MAVFSQSPALTSNPSLLPVLLQPESFRHYIETFNQNDDDLYSEVQWIKNDGAWDFLKDQIPFFECPDENIQKIYYFRWWTYRKHIQQTPDGFVITQFLPKVKWAGRYNTINCAAAFHIREGRWLHDPQYIGDYLNFWLRKKGALRSYSFWISTEVWNDYLVTGDSTLMKDLFPDLLLNYQEWENSRLDSNGLFWQTANRDGMDLSAGGDGYRPTINSYMYGDAMALAEIATLKEDSATAKTFREKALLLKERVQNMLWDDSAQFFKVLTRTESGATRKKFVESCELAGYTPWYFNLPDAGFESAWKQLRHPQGFEAPFGLTTCEQRSPQFKIAYSDYECQWNGPVWPFATSITLGAMANLLNHYSQEIVTTSDYFHVLSTYATSQHLQKENNIRVPWIDENLNPTNGDWIARTQLKTRENGAWPREKGGEERGKDYNHSMYMDHIITGLVGLRPRADDIVEVNPLIPKNSWD